MPVERECGKAIRSAIHAEFSMAIFTFMEKLKALCRPETALQKNSSGVPYAWIVDDCTLVPSRRRVLEIVRFIIEQGPTHGLIPNICLSSSPSLLGPIGGGWMLLMSYGGWECC